MNTFEQHQPIEITLLQDTELNITIGDEPITLPSHIQNQIDEHWQSVLAERPHLYNGTVFSVLETSFNPDAVTVTMAKSNFAHNVFSEIYDLGEHAYRVLHSATLVITRDNHVVLGEMSQDTARPGAICFSGGAIEPEDIIENKVDLAGNTIRELSEELGVNANDSTQVVSFAPAYLKTGGPKGKITIVYRADLALSSDEFQKQYNAFVRGLHAKGERPEFEQLYLVKNTLESIAEFIAAHPELDEYVPPVLRAISEYKQ